MLKIIMPLLAECIPLKLLIGPVICSKPGPIFPSAVILPASPITLLCSIIDIIIEVIPKIMK